MSKIPNRDAGLAQCRMQYERSMAWAQWHLQGASNGYALRHRGKRGSEPTSEERASGMVVKWRPLTDEEAIDDYMDTAYTHFENARKLQDIILCYLNDDPDSLARAQENYYK